MNLRTIVLASLVAAFVAAPAWGTPTKALAVSVKPITHVKTRNVGKQIKHPLLLRVKRARNHAQGKTSATAKQFDLSGALRSAK